MVSAAHFSFMGICRNTTFEVLYYNLFSGISRWYHYHKSEVNSMKTEKKEINIQIGKRLQTARENSGYTQEVFAETLDAILGYMILFIASSNTSNAGFCDFSSTLANAP